eukprot:5447363-Pleurochrysis_carterae.AAC.1
MTSSTCNADIIKLGFHKVIDHLIISVSILVREQHILQHDPDNNDPRAGSDAGHCMYWTTQHHTRSASLLLDYAAEKHRSRYGEGCQCSTEHIAPGRKPYLSFPVQSEEKKGPAEGDVGISRKATTEIQLSGGERPLVSECKNLPLKHVDHLIHFKLGSMAIGLVQAHVQQAVGSCMLLADPSELLGACLLAYVSHRYLPAY